MSWAGLDDFLVRAEAALDPVTGPERLEETGELDLLTGHTRTALRPAAVLMGIVPRKSGPRMVLTQRPKTMSTHPGQVAFPGGKVDAGDADAVAAALREAEEEVGLGRDKVRLVGRGAPYVTGTAFRITPVLALLPSDFEAEPDPFEVDEAFETPLEFLMTPANHLEQETLWKGRLRRYYEIGHGGYRIWGVTAGIIRNLYECVYREDA